MKTSGVYLSGLCCEEAPYLFDQTDILTFMLRETQADEALQRHLKILYRASGIRRRGSFLPDFGMLQPTFFSTHPPIDIRMQRYFETILPVAKQAATRSLAQSGLETKDITHLITVSCTGMAAPGLDLQLMKALTLPAHTHNARLYTLWAAMLLFTPGAWQKPLHSNRHGIACSLSMPSFALCISPPRPNRTTCLPTPFLPMV